jgi:hypothetical protein
MTRRTFQAPSRPLKIEPPSPDRVQAGGGIENFDTMSAQSSEPTYIAQRHHRQSSSWTSPPHYSELVNSYGSQQRTPCTIQTQIQHQPKVEPSLPSIHDLTYPSSFSHPSPYTYGASTGSYNDHRNFSLKTEPSYPVKGEPQTYYDTPQNRYGQHYSQINRPSAPHLDCQRYPGLYEYKGIAFPSSYSMEYIPSPTGSHHPVSPTVSNGDGCGIGAGGRKRRGNLPKQITDYLKGWFMQHLEHPYPTEDDKQQFVHDTGLTIAQVSTLNS